MPANEMARHNIAIHQAGRTFSISAFKMLQAIRSYGCRTKEKWANVKGTGKL